VTAGVLLAFGAGVVIGRLSPPRPANSAPEAFDWPLFGRPRAAGAPRPAAPKPEGFAVRTTRIDTSRPEPLACVRMTRALDPTRSYGDFVQLQPDLGHA